MLPQPDHDGPRSGWAFRPSVLARLLDAHNGRLDAAEYTAYRYEKAPFVTVDPMPARQDAPVAPAATTQPATPAFGRRLRRSLRSWTRDAGKASEQADIDSHPRTTARDPGVAILTEPTGQLTTVSRISSRLPHCAPPPAIARWLPQDEWAVTAFHLPKPSTSNPTTLALLTTAHDAAIEELYVDAPIDVEARAPDDPVYVNARWTVPARTGFLLVPGNHVIVYEPETDAEPGPIQLADHEEWLPYCRHCDEPLFDSGCIPGMYHPLPDIGPDDSLWCPARPHSDRPRPHAATCRRVDMTLH